MKKNWKQKKMERVAERNEREIRDDDGDDDEEGEGEGEEGDENCSSIYIISRAVFIPDSA
jgi:hypothetical protein